MFQSSTNRNKKPINHRNPYKTLSQRANPSSHWSNLPANMPPKRPDPSSHWRNPPAQNLPSDPKYPAGGRILPSKIRSATQNIQSLEETGQSTAFQQTNLSSHWKNHPAYRPLSILILPTSGGIGTQKAIHHSSQENCTRLSGSRPRWVRGRSSFRRQAIHRRNRWEAYASNAAECRPWPPSFASRTPAYSPNCQFPAAASKRNSNNAPTRISVDSRNSRATDDPH